MVEPFVPLIRTTFEKYPTLRASRLYAMVRERGYRAGELPVGNGSVDFAWEPSRGRTQKYSTNPTASA